jgi:hypothetical protein
VDSGEVALAEVLALRSLLLNLHFRAAKGEPIPGPEMRGLIERADETKMAGGPVIRIAESRSSRAPFIVFFAMSGR